MPDPNVVVLNVIPPVIDFIIIVIRYRFDKTDNYFHITEGCRFNKVMLCDETSTVLFIIDPYKF